MTLEEFADHLRTKFGGAALLDLAEQVDPACSASMSDKVKSIPYILLDFAESSRGIESDPAAISVDEAFGIILGFDMAQACKFRDSMGAHLNA